MFFSQFDNQSTSQVDGYIALLLFFRQYLTILLYPLSYGNFTITDDMCAVFAVLIVCILVTSLAGLARLILLL